MAQDSIGIDGNLYDLIQSIQLDGIYYAVAECPDAEKSFLCWRHSIDRGFGEESHMIPIFSNDYVHVMREFIKQISVALDGLDLDRIYRGSDYPLDKKDCVPDGMDANIKGKVVAIKPDALLPEYRSCSHQLMLATGGFGCSPNSNGRAVFGINIYSGEQERWNRRDNSA